jgi:hypothetical protein
MGTPVALVAFRRRTSSKVHLAVERLEEVARNPGLNCSVNRTFFGPGILSLPLESIRRAHHSRLNLNW